MRLRAVHFACVLLLLSSLGTAEASSRAGAILPGQYVNMLLQQGVAAVSSEPAFCASTAAALEIAAPSASVAQSHAIWTMRPPSAQCAGLQAVTSFGR